MVLLNGYLKLTLLSVASATRTKISFKDMILRRIRRKYGKAGRVAVPHVAVYILYVAFCKRVCKVLSPLTSSFYKR